MFKNLFKRYYLISTLCNGFHVQFYGDRHPAELVADGIPTGNKIVVLNWWRISRRQCLAIKEAAEKAKENKGE